jgi:hypothetical protein
VFSFTVVLIEVYPFRSVAVPDVLLFCLVSWRLLTTKQDAAHAENKRN